MQTICSQTQQSHYDMHSSACRNVVLHDVDGYKKERLIKYPRSWLMFTMLISRRRKKQSQRWRMKHELHDTGGRVTFFRLLGRRVTVLS